MLKTKLYGISYLNKSSVKSETISNTWLVQSCELPIAFSRNKSKCMDIGVLYVEEAERKSSSYLLTVFQARERVQNEERHALTPKKRAWSNIEQGREMNRNSMEN